MHGTRAMRVLSAVCLVAGSAAGASLGGALGVQRAVAALTALESSLGAALRSAREDRVSQLKLATVSAHPGPTASQAEVEAAVRLQSAFNARGTIR